MNPYDAPETEERPRGTMSVFLLVIVAAFAGFFGLGTLLSLWGMLYWRSESMRQLPQAESEEALYDYHAWMFLLIVSGFLCCLFTGLVVWKLRSWQTTSKH